MKEKKKKKKKEYKGITPPCGIDCNGCYKFHREENSCEGAETGCKMCKTIYKCSVEKKGHQHCYECSKFPCSKFKKFAKTWEPYGQDLIENQKQLRIRKDGL